MAELKLNTTTSIVDFLKSQGKPSDSKSLSSLYTSSGLADRLGTYVGSGSQNTALLKSLSSPTVTQTAPTAVDTSSFTPEQLKAYNYAASLAPGAQTQQNQTTQPQTQPTAPTTIGTSGITADQARASIPQTPSAEEILNSVLSSAGFQNFQQGQQLDKTLATGEAEAQKALFEARSKADTKQFVDSMGRRGLFFSGETQTGLQALAESLASSKLGIDRKLAGDLLRSDLKTKQEIIDQVSDLVKEAQNGRKEAISALEKVGLTVIGDEVVPTLAARNAELAEANRQADNIRQDINQAISLEKLEFSEQAAARAEKYLQLAEERAARAADGEDGIKLSSEDKANVVLYGPKLTEAMTTPDANGQTASPDEAVEAVANFIYASTGTTLKATSRVALLDYAREEAARIKKDISQQQVTNSVEQSLFSSPIEADIAQYKKSGNLTDADIRFILQRKYSPEEITNSSIGGALNKTLSGISSVFKSLGF